MNINQSSFLFKIKPLYYVTIRYITNFIKRYVLYKFNNLLTKKFTNVLLTYILLFLFSSNTWSFYLCFWSIAVADLEVLQGGAILFCEQKKKVVLLFHI